MRYVILVFVFFAFNLSAQNSSFLTGGGSGGGSADIDLVQKNYVPTYTGNSTDLGSIILDLYGNKWQIDDNGNATNLSAPTFPDSTEIVFILGGQSNADGRGLNSAATTEELAETTDLIVWDTTSQAWENLDIGINNQVQGGSATYHGIELGMAAAARSYFGRSIRLIKFAKGSTAIDEHRPGNYLHGKLYNYCTVPAINKLIEDGYKPLLNFVYMQGSADSGVTDSTTQVVYGEKLNELVQAWRDKLGGRLPFIASDIVHSDANDSLVNNNFRRKALSDAFFNHVMTQGFTTDGGPHYDYQGLKDVAVQVFEAQRKIGFYGVAINDYMPIVQQLSEPDTITYDFEGFSENDSDTTKFRNWQGHHNILTEGGSKRIQIIGNEFRNLTVSASNYSAFDFIEMPEASKYIELDFTIRFSSTASKPAVILRTLHRNNAIVGTGLLFDPNANTIQFRAIANGGFQELYGASVSFTMNADTDYRFRFIVDGTTASLENWNGSSWTSLGTRTDINESEFGRVSFMTGVSSTAYDNAFLDDLTIIYKQ